MTEADMKRGFWARFGWMAMAAVLVLGALVWVYETVTGKSSDDDDDSPPLMPMIALQTVFFAAMSAALRSATDSVHGINLRFRAMPIVPMAPLAARMSGNLYRCAAALGTALLCGYVIGFRFYRSGIYTVSFCILVLLIGIW